MKHLIVTLFFLIASTTLFAYDAEIDGIYYNFSGDEAEVTFQKRGEDQFPLSDYSGSIVIPEHVVYKEKSYNVTSIGMQAFRGCSGLTSINIPESVISIGGGAFLGCSSLNTINVGPNVERIYREVFDGTPWYYNLPDGMVYVGKIAYKYKGEMPKGTHYSIKEGTSSISEDAFMGCCGLTSITIPESVTCLEERVFEGCVNLVSVNLPESMTSIGGYAFSHCSSLSSINIPKGVTKIGSNAFWFCSSLTSFTIPEESRGIEKGVFADAKFDSRPELLLARLLEREADVKKWLRPAPAEFELYYKGRHTYEPDFVAQTDDCNYLIEVKGEDRINDEDVIAKKQRAITYCSLATKWSQAHGYMPWKHLFIPSQAISIISSFTYLSNNFIAEQ